ncbi:MAG: hypothetical protein K8W52_14635 [Deltaproteobacteria bacterium]|nr:hypothetical protein [Deltaproteobacteria bacterium]
MKTRLLALAAPALLLWSSPSRADAPVAPTSTALAAAPSPAPGMVALARILGAIASATAATVTSPMCDTAGRPMAGNVGKSMPDHACSLDERLRDALALAPAGES